MVGLLCFFFSLHQPPLSFPCLWWDHKTWVPLRGPPPKLTLSACVTPENTAHMYYWGLTICRLMSQLLHIPTGGDVRTLVLIGQSVGCFSLQKLGSFKLFYHGSLTGKEIGLWLYTERILILLLFKHVILNSDDPITSTTTIPPHNFGPRTAPTFRCQSLGLRVGLGRPSFIE